MKNTPEKWNAALYLRLSKEDKDRRDESNSIKNQRDLLTDYAGRHPDICVSRIFSDDGATGANYDRDGFRDMIEAIESGEINACLVKDFSRLGRDHIETGKYIERYFASKNVRFIAVNDNYDSLISDMTDRTNSLTVPFRNIVNEAMLEDISVKTRSNLAIKRKNGELVCNYAVYGYTKTKDKRLVPDEYAADVVRYIFERKIGGQNEGRIAATLNEKGILSPAEHKKALGLKYHTPFAMNGKSGWTVNAVKRILTNRVYIGALEQGKRSKPSYRVKKLSYKPREEWSVHENSHEPIIDPQDFELVRELMAMDTRVAAGSGQMHKLSGFVRCGYCGRPMAVKTVRKNENTYLYYVCSTHKKSGTCRYNSVSAAAVEDYALLSVQNQVAALASDGIPGGIDLENLKSRRQAAVENLIDRNMETIRENQGYLVKSHKHFVDGIISEDEFKIFKTAFNKEIADAESNISALQAELARLADDRRGMEFLDRFKEYGNVTELDRRIVVTLFKSIVITDKEIAVNFRFSSAFEGFEAEPAKGVM